MSIFYKKFKPSVALVALIVVGQVQAQSDSSEGAVSVREKKRTSRLLEEVVVTAQKREENLQDVPISVQAFSEETLDALGIFNQADLQMVTPTLNVSNLMGFTTVYLRGVGTDAYLTADPSVATYIDGIYLPIAVGLTQDFGVIERVEVLKGPQGTLFGRNASGGALNITTRDPLLGEFDAQINLTAANYPELHAKAYISVPIGDHLAFSFSPVYLKTEHFFDNTAPETVGDDHDDEAEGYRVKLRWAPFDWVDMTLAAQKVDSDTPSAQMIPAEKSTYLGQLIGIEETNYEIGDDETALDHCCTTLIDNEMFYGKIGFFTPWFDIKLIGSDQYIKSTTMVDFDGSGQQGLGLSNFGYGGDIQTAEFQLISNEESWGSDWMRWIVGAYKFRGTTGYWDPGERLELHGNLLSPVLVPFNGILSTPDVLGLDILPELETGFAYAKNLVESVSESVFAQATFTLTDWLDLTLGIRHQDEGRELLNAEFGLLLNGETEVPITSYDYAETQEGDRVATDLSTKTTSPKVSVELHPFDDDTLIYLSYQEATKSGTYNGFAITSAPTYAKPETIEAWELGIKTKFLHDTLIFSGAIFDYTIHDQQVQHISLTTGGSVAFENAELAEIRGIDFDVTWLIAPHLVEDLVLVGGAGWLETAEFTSYPHARGYTNNTGVTSEDQDFSGNRIPKTPEISGNLALSKTWFFDSGELELATDMYYTDKFFYESSNRELTTQGSYTLWGARVGYLYEPWNVRLTVFGRNLTDEATTRGSLGLDFGNWVTPGAPKTYGMRLAWKY